MGPVVVGRKTREGPDQPTGTSPAHVAPALSYPTILTPLMSGPSPPSAAPFVAPLALAPLALPLLASSLSSFTSSLGAARHRRPQPAHLRLSRGANQPDEAASPGERLEERGAQPGRAHTDSSPRWAFADPVRPWRARFKEASMPTWIWWADAACPTRTSASGVRAQLLLRLTGWHHLHAGVPLGRSGRRAVRDPQGHRCHAQHNLPLHRRS